MKIDFELDEDKTFLENLRNEGFLEEDINIYDVIPFFQDKTTKNLEEKDGNVYLISKNTTYCHGTIPIVATCLILNNEITCELNLYNENICYILNQNILSIRDDDAIWMRNQYGDFLWNRKMNLLQDLNTGDTFPDDFFDF